MIITTHQLSKAYGTEWALKDVNLNFNKGDCVALLGPNGSGKTTLLRLLSALLTPSLGMIEFNGKKLSQRDLHLRSSISILSPDSHLYKNLTAGENLLFFTSLHGIKKNIHEVDEILERVGLSTNDSQCVSSFSKGMKCRLSIAKSFLLEPDLLMLDEPYGALDGLGVDILEGFLKHLCTGGGIVILVTHNVQRALSVCSRALILNRGRIIFDEPKVNPWKSFNQAYAPFLPMKEQ